MFSRIKKLFADKNEITQIENADKKRVSLQIEEEMTGKQNLSLLQEMAKLNNVPIYKGAIVNAYESDFLGYKDHCPLCDTPTVQHTTNFIWANQVASRIMAAPAGYFCPNCPTVIIDDDLIQSGIDKSRFEYWGVCGIETGYEKKKGDSLFQTFNGQKPTYILTEEGGLDGILNSVHTPDGGLYATPDAQSRILLSKTIQAKKKKEKNKSHNKQARQARKMNRR
jgi:hypothetical protein